MSLVRQESELQVIALASQCLKRQKQHPVQN